MKEHLKKWNQRFEAYPRRLPEYLAFVLYLCLNLIVGYFHEPWFDEALAWQIARHCSIIDILFYIPHYEGHPPLWHLLLLPFARLGAPYEWSLLLVSVAIMSVAVGLLLKYAPFPRIIKLLLPFTFFLGYQYSVISRPYSLMFLAFVILAYRYGQRNTKPLHYILALMFLCLTNAYGIVFAGGLALVWIWEIWNRQTLLPFMKEFLKDKRCWGLAVLLVWALALIAEFMPYSDTFSNRATVTCGLVWRVLYTLLVLPADATCTQVYDTNYALRMVRLDPFIFACGCITGIMLWGMLLYYGRKKKTMALFVVPYTLFGVFSALVYMYVHHTGIAFLYLLFWLWVSRSQPDSVTHSPGTSKRLSSVPPKLRRLAKTIAACTICYILLISLWWTGCSCVNDIRLPYSGGRDLSRFIKEHHLNEYQMMAAWTVWDFDVDGASVLVEDTNHTNLYSLLPYFEDNIFYNGAFGTDGVYCVHRIPSSEEIEEALSSWRAVGPPDVIVGYAHLAALFDKDVTLSDYSLVFFQISRHPWKNSLGHEEDYIYVRNDLLEELDLEAIPEEEYLYVF